MTTDAKTKSLIFIDEILVRLNIKECWARNTLESLKLCWNDRLFNTLMGFISSKIDEVPGSNTLFNLPLSQQEIGGELDLGQVIETENIRFRIPIGTLPMHLCIAGFSGSGKSTLAIRIVEEAIRNNIKSIWIVDPKADDYLKLAFKYPDIMVLKWNDLRFAPLKPPSNVPHNEYFQTFVSHLSHIYNFWEGAESYLLTGINYIFRNSKYVDLIHLLNWLKFGHKATNPKDAMIKSTVISRLEMLLMAFGPTITTDSAMLEYLGEKKVIISTSGLMPESDSWFNEHLLCQEYLYRNFNPGSRYLYD